MKQIDFSYDKKIIQPIEVPSKNSFGKGSGVANKVFNLGVFSEDVDGGAHIVICFVGNGNPDNLDECPVICKVMNTRRAISDEDCIEGWIDAIILYLKLGQLRLSERNGRREIYFDERRKDSLPPGFNSGHYRIAYDNS